MIRECRLSKLKVVIFDCDGVMFDSKEANEAYYNHILERFGKPKMGVRQCEYVHMNTATRSVAFLFDGDPLAKKAEAYREELSYSPFISMMRMEPYLMTLLKQLRVSYKTAIATNRSDTMNQVLKEHGLKGYFDLVVSSLDVKAPKPAPEALLKILCHFGVSAGEAIYIGDSQIDEMTAKAAEISLIAYKNRNLSAIYHVDHFREVKDLLGKSLTA